MKVTRNVVNDLLPLYEAGEASEDSRALVEDFLRDHPEARREISERLALANSLATPPLPSPSPNLERDTLERTRRYIRTRNILVGLAIALWIVPFTFTFGPDGVRWILWRDNPLLAVLCIVASTLISAGQTWYDWRRRREEAHR
ncbi:MAG: hypothetical protein AAB011_12985 [Candidatus Eisenbacteria bacterium]